MGFIDGLRRAFRSQCDHLIKYQAGVFSFNGFGADVPSVNVSVAGLRTGIVKLEHATEVAKNLDNYQFLMCKLCHELSRSSNLLEKIVRARAVALGGINFVQQYLGRVQRGPERPEIKLESSRQRDAEHHAPNKQ